MPVAEATNTNQPSNENEASGQATADYEKLVRQVADSVWAMWQRELKRDAERRGTRKYGR